MGSSKEDLEIWRMLHDEKHDGSVCLYNPDFHPEDIVQYFRERFDALDDAERYESKHHLTYVSNPVRPPSLAGYCARVGISTSTLWSWAQKYTVFDDAVGQCKAMQEAMIIELTSVGAYNPAFAALMMKNLHEWQDKLEQTHKGGVTLVFDEQDESA